MKDNANSMMAKVVAKGSFFEVGCQVGEATRGLVQGVIDEIGSSYFQHFMVAAKKHHHKVYQDFAQIFPLYTKQGIQVKS